jgi:hypothetical protein
VRVCPLNRGYVFCEGTCPRASDEFEAKFTTNQSRHALKALDRDVSLGFQDAIDLGAARVDALGKSGLGKPLPFHFLAQLPSHDARQRIGPGRPPNAILAEEFVDGRAPMRVLFPAH